MTRLGSTCFWCRGVRRSTHSALSEFAHTFAVCFVIFIWEAVGGEMLDCKGPDTGFLIIADEFGIGNSLKTVNMLFESNSRLLARRCLSILLARPRIFQ